MSSTLLTFLCTIAISLPLLADENPVTIHKEWGKACGGTNIAITIFEGKIVGLEAYAEGFSEGFQWNCHFIDGKIISALYRHYKITRKPDNAEGKDGSFAIESEETAAKTFHFPNHELGDIDPTLKKQLEEILKIASEPEP